MRSGGDDPPPPARRDERKSVAEMFADLLREAAVLIAVFGWLDKAVKGESFWGRWGLQVLAVATVLFFLGVALERLRSPELH